MVIHLQIVLEELRQSGRKGERGVLTHGRQRERERDTGVGARLVSYLDTCERHISSSHFYMNDGDIQARRGKT